MTRLNLELELPETLAREAQAAGLLTPEELARMVREALRAKRAERLATALGTRCQSAAADDPEEIQAEIETYRAEVRRAAGT